LERYRALGGGANDGLMTVRWRRRAHDKATLAAIQKNRQPVLRVSAAVAFRVSGNPG
jgi:hypothetical protein